ncbi:recombination regulator RecX [Vibrio sp.]|uniref:recombination regulator RecX n=1 Tax=Vibrio sp. TaxID=678 RepID=UPI003D14263B
MASTPYQLSAKQAAIHLLSRRDHGQYELSQKLAQRGYPEQEIEQAIEFCLAHRYLEDLRYAKSQVRQHIAKGHGERRIRQELQQRRVAEQDIEQALQEQQQDWFELARQVAEKKYRCQGGKDDKEYAKRVRFLQYRGFGFDQIRYALESLPAG